MGKIDSWVTKIPRLKNSKVARFSYKAEAYANDTIEGVDSYDYSHDMNVPLATHTDFDASVLSTGARANFSSIPKNGLNHFFGRVSYNLNKVIDFLSDLLDDLRVQGVETVASSVDVTLGAYYSGKKLRLANTHTINSITFTFYTGQTYQGSNTISIPAGRSIDIELIGTTWRDSLTGNLTGNVSGNAGTATKLATPRTINGVSFDGSANITVADSTKAPTSHASSANTYGVSSEANYGHAKASAVAGSANGTASKGSTPTIFAQSDHVHPLQTSVSGNAGTATKLATPRTINGVSFDGSANITVADSTKAPTSHASSANTYGVSSEANYGHAKASAVAGSANGTASKGSTPTIFAQSDHVHPLQTSVSGNAGTADKWKTARNITISDADGTNTGTAVSVDGSENETLKLPAIIKASVTGNADTASKANVRVSLRHGSTVFSKTWAGISGIPLYSSSIWAEGDNIYYSYLANQFMLNKTTSTWVAKTWAGLTDFYGDRIWADGDNTYYSNATTQYELNKATSTWVVKTWYGLTNFTGIDIWTDGSNIYYSTPTQQYVLNRATSTWVAKTWNNLTDFEGRFVWTSGESIYYSSGTKQRVLNKATSTWSLKLWDGLPFFNGNQIWTDGDNIYHSTPTQQFVLNKPFTWVAKTWTAVTDFEGYAMWTDGENIYSATSTQYVVIPATRHNYVDDDKYNSLFGTVTKCICSTLSDRFVFRNE